VKSPAIGIGSVVGLICTTIPADLSPVQVSRPGRGYFLCMARCGRCGLWAKYPPNWKERKYAGVCMWYRFRLPEDQVYDERKCPEFFEAMPQWNQQQHWNYATRHDDLGRSWHASRRALTFSLISLVLSAVGIAFKFI